MKYNSGNILIVTLLVIHAVFAAVLVGIYVCDKTHPAPPPVEVIWE